MKQRFIKSIIVTVLVFSVFLCSALSAFALPINNVSNSYFYNVDGYDASAPVSFTVEKILTVSDLVENVTATTKFSPSDLFYKNGYLYILDSEGNSLFVLDEQYQVVSHVVTLTGEENIPELKIPADTSASPEEGSDSGKPNRSSKTSLNAPEGLFVTDEGDIYIADTENQRIVVCDINGKVSKVYQEIEISVLGDNYSFKPTKLVVDNTGTLQLVCSGINRGIVQITSDGEFEKFFGAPDVVISFWQRIWRNFATEEQLAQMSTFSPTEYSNLTIDDRGFIYPTISALDEAAVKALKQLSVASSYAPVKKLSADGTDMLRRKGLAAPMGDLTWAEGENTNPKIVDISVDSESGRYTILDQQTGRFFTYDADGNMLYLCGGAGTSAGTFTLPTALAMNGDYVYISDAATTTNSITVFRATDYVRSINKAAEATANGEWEASIPLWKEVLSYNSNMFIANIGLGKAEMRIAMNLIDDQVDENGMNALDHYEEAIKYFDRANEKTNYSIAYTALRTNELEQNFGLIFAAIGVLVVGLFVLNLIRKYRKKKKAKPVTRSSDREAPKVNRAKKKGDEE